MKEKEYVGYNSGVCPCCGNEDIEYTENSIDGDELTFFFVCSKCGGAGSEIYKLEYEESNVIITEFE